jgi:hypothetical protein
MVEQNPGNIEAIATRATRICFLGLDNSRGSPSTAGFQTNLERMRLLHFMTCPVSQKINQKKRVVGSGMNPKWYTHRHYILPDLGKCFSLTDFPLPLQYYKLEEYVGCKTVYEVSLGAFFKVACSDRCQGKVSGLL